MHQSCEKIDKKDILILLECLEFKENHLMRMEYVLISLLCEKISFLIEKFDLEEKSSIFWKISLFELNLNYPNFKVKIKKNGFFFYFLYKKIKFP